MSALRHPEPPRRFTTYAEVEVDVDPEDLEREGWVYVGKDKDAPVSLDTRMESLIRAFHDDEHEGPWRWCRHPLCDEAR